MTPNYKICKIFTNKQKKTSSKIPNINAIKWDGLSTTALRPLVCEISG